MNSIKAVSLFSGCGGMDLGFSQAGIEVIWANDKELSACMTYARNIGNHIVCDDISEIDIEALPHAEVIIGGFPCQDFSIIWKRGGVETSRGNLYLRFVAAVSHIQPLVFVAENVKGLLSANKGEAIKRIVDDFTNAGKHGYKVQVHLVNFAEYGVAQLRKRVLIVGVRSDIEEEFEFPEPTHQKGSYVTASEALYGVEGVPANNRKKGIQNRTVERLKIIPPGGNYSDVPKDHPLYAKGMISHFYRRLHPDKPAKTIIASGGGGTWEYHFAEPRPLTNRERARLFGYPDNFVFEGTIAEVRRQIGNSIPPLGIKPVAERVRELVLKSKIVE